MLTENDLQSFEKNGYLCPIPIHSGAEVDRVQASFNELEAVEGKEHCQVGLAGRHVDRPFIWELATNEKILDAMEDLLGPDILLLSTHFFCKYPDFSDRFVAWHQDVTYWGLEPPIALTAWYAVDNADLENGCMVGIPCTHALGILEHVKAQTPGNLLSINQEVDVSGINMDRRFNFELKAGEISIHHGHLIHGSNPNKSARRRAGLTLRYVPPHVKPVRANSMNRPWPAILVRGEDRYGHFGELKLEFQSN